MLIYNMSYRPADKTLCIVFLGTRCQSALLYGLLEPLSKHLQVCIPREKGERWEPLL